MIGLKAEFKNVFGELSAEQTSVYLSSDEAVESLREFVPDEGVDLFDALGGVYSSYVLQGLLSYAPGETLSSNMIAKYEIYKDDLKTLKSLVRKYASDSYEEWFRGPKYPDGSGYDASKAKGYTRYNLGTSKQSYENFAKEVKKLFQGTGAEFDERYQAMMERFENQRFMRRLKTSDNGSIYYQLHLEELDAILRNQGQHYPFLVKELEKIESLVSFRIPYYVGPLTSKNAAKDGNGNCRFAWSERFPGMENAAITPWNWNQVIDGSASAQKFIERMTGVCTYLQGEEVLPKCSLLYEEFCVLNELNSFRWSMGGDKEHRFDAADREGIIEDVFKCYRSVDCRKLKEWLEREMGHMDVKVTGGRDKTRFESKMSSYLFFCKDVFKVERLDESDYPMIEKIILWNTLFEDRKILKERLMATYGPLGEGRLTETQVKTICKKRFTGWGKLSRRFLEGLKIDTACGPRSIMDVLREGNPFAGRQGRTMVLMEIINDEDLGFKDKIEEFNKEYFEKKGKELGVNELPGSPAIRRSLNQAIRIVDEIVKIAGKAPRNIFIEVTRDDELDKRGKYTKRRYDALKDALSAFKKEDPAVWAELQAKSPSDLDERLTLYFAQRGKCLYSGAPIDINRLSCGDY
ncbi:MAG: type II CRISPR RNA-guided endonuclease Cas9, partial [Coriobacteriia bacterium]|nr:type II CRISPR RNA-guided endonuclease Cas9 [Coriobacteriia bacterium]